MADSTDNWPPVEVFPCGRGIDGECPWCDDEDESPQAGTSREYREWIGVES